ncbi:hypothetical protein [Fulvivirga lutimaris]|uniref:hypothetical protein n=1 Tax=Fulvivirga lutimaris TaxID=1819566 RepID=UPI0012BD5CAF|nr:hypothetical protein [Fulvivirga lutimaris]MTI42001.1 hypothetical protein [Fulvivirga lutimaris]
MNSLLKLAIRELGHNTYINPKHDLSKLYQKLKSKSSKQADDLSVWSSAFINWVTRKAGIKHDDVYEAQDWLEVGENSSEKPEAGDLIIIEWEEDGLKKAYVGFYIWYSNDNTQVYCLGGKHDNEVAIVAMPAKHISGLRRLDSVNIAMSA